MRGRWIQRAWPHDPAANAPPKYRRACSYEAFLPDPLSGFQLALGGSAVGVVAYAQEATRDLNEAGRPALKPLARLLLRTESIASSKVEGMQMGAVELARAEARLESGGKAGQN